MLNFCSLYSGSTGNCLFVQSKNTNILVDAGVSLKKIEEALSSILISADTISAIIITHEHSDHIKGIGTLSKKYNIPVFANKETWNQIPLEQKAKIAEQNIKTFEICEKFTIGDIDILPFHIPHDAANPCGFNIYNESSKISIATDLGHITPEILKNLENSSFILLESNYEPEILKCCSYPYLLKKRIDGPTGHLSNNLAGQTISKLIPLGLNSVMLGHLSKENNFPELAYKTVLEELKNNNYTENCINLNIADRYSPSKIISVS
jgi:phosphoribosyl 1,2-cyclic phosphodiesterase